MRDTYTELAQRVDDVTEMYGEYNSLHEAYSVLLEEVGELAIPNFFMDLCRERMYSDTFTEYLEEAKKRREQKKGVV